MCDGCENTVKKAIESVDGVLEVNVSHSEEQAVVKYDAEKTDALFIHMAVNNTSYKVLS